MKKRILSLLLVFVLCLSLMPTMAFATSGIFKTQPSFSAVDTETGTISYELNEEINADNQMLVKNGETAEDSFSINHQGANFPYTAYKGDGKYQVPEGQYKVAVKVHGDWYYSEVFEIKYEIQPVPKSLPGDVDGDGKLSAADARLALRKSVGLEDYKEGSNKFLACDVDHDGKVSAADARLILRASVGLEDPQKW